MFPGRWIVFLEFYPGFSLFRGLYEFSRYAFQGNLNGKDGMKWEDFNDSAMDEVFFIMIIEWFVALIAANYIDKIFSSGKHPLFFLKTPFKKSPSPQRPSLQKQVSAVSEEMEKLDVTQEVLQKIIYNQFHVLCVFLAVLIKFLLVPIRVKKLSN